MFFTAKLWSARYFNLVPRLRRYPKSHIRAECRFQPIGTPATNAPSLGARADAGPVPPASRSARATSELWVRLLLNTSSGQRRYLNITECYPKPEDFDVNNLSSQHLSGQVAGISTGYVRSIPYESPSENGFNTPGGDFPGIAARLKRCHGH